MFSATLHELRRECANIEPPRTPSSMPEVKTSISKRTLLSATCLALLFLCATVSLKAQTEEAFGDAATDPVRLFERGQSAHARGELEKAIGFYEQALRVRPDRKSTRLNSSHSQISYAVFCLKKKKQK